MLRFCQNLGEFREETVTTLVFSVLSLNSAAFILVSFLQLRVRAFDSKLMPKLIAFLALGDFGWALTNVVYNSLLLTHGNLGCCAPWACLWARALQQFFALSTVFFTLCIAFFLTLATYRPRQDTSSHNMFVGFVVFSLGLALVLDVALMLRPMQVSGGGWCLPSYPWHLILWFAPILVCFIICVVLYVMILKKVCPCRFRVLRRLRLTFSVPVVALSFFCCFSHDSHFSQYYGVFGCRSRPRGPRSGVPVPVRLMFYVLVFIVTWCVFVDLPSSFVDRFSLPRALDLVEFVWWQSDVPCPLIFQLIATTTVNSQGLMNFIVYGILNSELRKSYSWVSGILTWLFAPLYVLPLAIWTAIQMSRSHPLQTLSSHAYSPISLHEDTDT
jgi:hypothetical protein